MRAVVVCGVVVACLLRVASAQTPPSAAPPSTPVYPLAITDRPILLYPGMTEFDFSVDFPTYLQTTVDAMGNTVVTRTGLTDNAKGSLFVAHAFGPVQVSVATGRLAYAGVSLNTGTIPAVLTLSVSSSFAAGYRDPNYYYDAQGFSFRHKLHVSPGRFAVYGGAGVSLIEYSSTLDTGMISAGHIVLISAQVTAEFQLTRRLGLYVGESLSAPASQSSSQHFTATLTSSVEIVFAAFRTWDFYGAFGLSDVTSARLPDLSCGFAKRWGN